MTAACRQIIERTTACSKFSKNKKRAKQWSSIEPRRYAMDWTLVRAGRNTHIKIVAVALAAVIVLVTVGIHARIERNDVASGPAVIKAGAPAAYAGQERSSVR
jgi:hypothetical protein